MSTLAASVIHATHASPALDRRAFDLLCLTIATVLALHTPHLPWWLSVALALLLALRWWQRRQHGTRIRWWLRLPLTLLLPVAVLITYGTIFGRLPGTALAVGLLVLKALESERIRDARTGIALACFVLMCALLFGQSLLMTLAVILGLLPALAGLRALQPTQTTSGWTPEALSIGKTLLLSVPLALVVFLFLPRLSSPLWGVSQGGVARTGVDDRMSPGDFTQLLVDDSPAFRVSFQGPPPPPQQRYFRGPVLWWFDGRSWTGLDRLSPLHQLAPEPLVQSGTTVLATVTMQPSHRHWLFALDTPLAAPPGAHMNVARTLLRNKPIDKLLRYQVRSAPERQLAPRLGAAERRMGLELPAGYNPHAQALARTWRQQYGHDDAAIARAALSLFHDGGFRYTLVPPPLGRDSIDDFLFDTKAGFCEHYASAFTFLMRAAGIPARVVTGYQGGWWNAEADYLLVRQSDAHAWSEIWLAGRGWTRFDPTAAVRPDRITLGAASAAGTSAQWYQQGWWRSLRNHWDVVNHWWNRAVTGFDALRQRGLLTPFGIRQTHQSTLLAALVGSLVLLMLVAAVVTLRPRRRHSDPLAAAMALLQRRLARVGVVRRTSEGPRHFFARAARALPHQGDQLQALGRAWVDLRYAQSAPEPKAAHAFCRTAREFRPRRVVQ